MKNVFSIIATLPLMVLASASFSQTLPTADEILKNSRDRDDGSSYASNVTLSLIGKGGSIRNRHFYMFQKDLEGNEERALMHFNKPADVRGVSFLIVNYGEDQSKADDQWMFLPAFRKTRRIGSNDKRGDFMGAVFNYSDLDKIRVLDYENTLLGEEEVLGKSAWLIERIPVSQGVINKTGYYKTKMWIAKESKVVLQQHYYNAKGVVFKIQQSTKIEKIQGIWTTIESRAEDLESEKSSIMTFTDIVYNVDVSDERVSKRSLKKTIRASDMPTPE
jgi:hypothetical protein